MSHVLKIFEDNNVTFPIPREQAMTYRKVGKVALAELARRGLIIDPHSTETTDLAVLSPRTRNVLYKHGLRTKADILHQVIQPLAKGKATFPHGLGISGRREIFTAFHEGNLDIKILAKQTKGTNQTLLTNIGQHRVQALRIHKAPNHPAQIKRILGIDPPHLDTVTLFPAPKTQAVTTNLLQFFGITIPPRCAESAGTRLCTINGIPYTIYCHYQGTYSARQDFFLRIGIRANDLTP